MNSALHNHRQHAHSNRIPGPAYSFFNTTTTRSNQELHGQAAEIFAPLMETCDDESDERLAASPNPVLAQTEANSTDFGCTSYSLLDPPSILFNAPESWEHCQERLMLQQFMSDRHIEVVAVLEGVDPSTGGVVQARHSFVCSVCNHCTLQFLF